MAKRDIHAVWGEEMNQIDVFIETCFSFPIRLKRESMSSLERVSERRNEWQVKSV